MRLRKVEDLNERGVCFIIYGQAGSGKTPIAAEAVFSQYASPMLHADAEGGTRSITHLKRSKVGDNLDIVTITRWAQIERLMLELKKGPEVHGYKGVIFDNCSELHDLRKIQEVGVSDNPSQPDWGIINRDFLKFVEDAKDLARLKGMVVFLICWDVDDKQENGKIKKHVAFTPQVQNTLPGKVDVIGHLSVATDQSRLLSFKQGPLTVSKFRRSMDSNEQKIPLEIKFNRNNRPFVDILEVIRGGGNWPADKYPKQQAAAAPARGGAVNPTTPVEEPVGNQDANAPEDNE